MTRYESKNIQPPADVLQRPANVFNVTIDYLVKDAEYQNIDNETLKRMKGLEKLSKEDKGHVFAMLDAFFAKAKLKSIL